MANWHFGETLSRNLPRLIIFDFDGTLVETEAVAARIVSGKLAASGSDLSPADVAAMLAGVSRRQERELLEGVIGRPLHDGFQDEIDAALAATIQAGLPPTPGAVEALRGLTVPFCIASNATRKDLILRMRAAQIFGLIGPRFFSSHDTGRHKPDPAVFLLAAEAMGIAPGDCLVVEDSTTGLRAARHAGMRCCAFVGAAHQSERMQADLRACEPDGFVTRISDLLHLLGSGQGSAGEDPPPAGRRS